MDKIKLGFIRKSKIEMDNETEKCFDILNTPENVNKMMVISDLNKPALCFVVKDLENSLSENFLNNSTNRQNIGRMIKYIMFNYGYTPISKGRLISRCKSKYFKTGTIYSKTIENPNYKIEIKII